MKRICLNKETLQGRELNNEELIKIRGGIEMNSHYTCTFRKHYDDEGSEYDYYVASSQICSDQCWKDHNSECDKEKGGCQTSCG